MVCIAFCLVLDILEIGVFAVGRLNPFMYLWLQVVKTTIWLALSAIAVWDMFSLQNSWGKDDGSENVARSLPLMGIVVPQCTLSVLL